MVVFPVAVAVIICGTKVGAESKRKKKIKNQIITMPLTVYIVTVFLDQSFIYLVENQSQQSDNKEAQPDLT